MDASGQHAHHIFWDSSCNTVPGHHADSAHCKHDVPGLSLFSSCNHLPDQPLHTSLADLRHVYNMPDPQVSVSLAEVKRLAPMTGSKEQSCCHDAIQSRKSACATHSKDI
eukprot:1142405-Pelagomonas_calceolata.AAC.7